MSLLESISSPDDVKQLSGEQLTELASEIRERIISVTAANGGYVGPNLGVVELTLGLHRVFSTPKRPFRIRRRPSRLRPQTLTGRNGEKSSTSFASLAATADSFHALKVST